MSESPVIPSASATGSEAHVYCAVLDVLGYRNLLEKDRKSGKREFKDLLQRALSILSNINQVQCQYEAISDTIFLVWPDRASLVDFLQWNKRLFVSFLENGLFLRGGITYSQHFRSGHVTYSFAIARSYELESQQAIYPRIVIDKNIIEMFQGGDDNLPGSDALLSSKLILRQNGTYFLNVIDEENWPVLYKAASALYKESSAELAEQESAFAKHVWFENLLFQSRFCPEETDRYIPLPTLLKALQ